MIGIHGASHPVPIISHPDYLSIEQQKQILAFRQNAKGAATKIAMAKNAIAKGTSHARLPTVTLAELGLRENLAEGSFETPRTAQAIKKLTDDFRLKNRRVLTMCISARQLDMIHPGSVEIAKHLHPSQPGLSTSSPNEDMKRIRIVWEYKPSRSGELNPEPIKLTDGRLVAAWLTKDESTVDLREFSRHTAFVADELGGNEAALKGSMFKRTLTGMLYRYKTYFSGMNDGLSTTRFNGQIGANLLLTSLPISALLYGLFYGIDYGITKREISRQKKELHSNAAIAGANGSTYSMGT